MGGKGRGNKGKVSPIERLCVSRKTVWRARAKKGVRQRVDHGLSQGLKRLDHAAQRPIPCSPQAAMLLDDRALSEMEGVKEHSGINHLWQGYWAHERASAPVSVEERAQRRACGWGAAFRCMAWPTAGSAYFEQLCPREGCPQSVLPERERQGESLWTDGW